jgi:hypothetical protein
VAALLAEHLLDLVETCGVHVSTHDNAGIFSSLPDGEYGWRYRTLVEEVLGTDS